MPMLMLCIAAKGVLRDADTNNVSIFSIIEQITPAGFPFVIQELAALAMWRREPGEGAVELQFRVLNNAHALHAGPIRVDFQGRERSRSFITLTGLVVPEPGRLSFVFERNGVEVARYDIEIIAPQPQAQVVPAPVAPAPAG